MELTNLLLNKKYLFVTKFLRSSCHEKLPHRVMVLGRLIASVQRVSRYCLEQMVEVLPYYGVPSGEEIGLFDPDLLIICLPVPDNFYLQTDKPFILWSELEANLKLPVASNPVELVRMLQQRLQDLN